MRASGNFATEVAAATRTVATTVVAGFPVPATLPSLEDYRSGRKGEAAASVENLHRARRVLTPQSRTLLKSYAVCSVIIYLFYRISFIYVMLRAFLAFGVCADTFFCGMRLVSHLT